MLEKNRPIAFLAATPVVANTKERFAMGQLVDMGYEVSVIDVSAIVDAQVTAKVTVERMEDNQIQTKYFDHIYQLETYLAAHPDTYYFLLFDYYYEVRKIYDLLTKYDVDYGNVSTALTDCLVMTKADGKRRLGGLLFRFSPKKWSRIYFNRVTRRSGKHKPSNFLLIGGRNGMDDVWNNCCCKEGITKQIYIRSFDCERFRNTEGYDAEGKPYAVFLDQGLPFHPDFIHSDEHIDAEKYFREVHDIFDVIRNRYGMEIIIAAHPRINYADKGDVWKGCPVVYGQSPQLVKNASLVMTHMSNSITFAVMADKPALILQLPAWDRGYHVRQMCQYWSKQLDAPIIRTGADLHEQMDYQPNEEAYDKTRYLYTESCENDNRSFWEIAVSQIPDGRLA